jgi:2-polyprenyl-3-methyl-5-hydroxy-6-metoxy-1,4-benzoquinol methylase
MSLIDFRDLVDKYSFAEHAARADKYFSTLDLDSPVARKPFASPHEAAELCAGIAAILPDLMLFPTVRVLDFGAGTCWMSRLLALVGCEVTAVDVSRKALEVGEKLIRSDPLASKLKVDFVALEGADLPFADNSFDRVVCFDALHHVPRQEHAISEFARVLRPGGIAALHEPGPSHSRSSQSQYEMRMYDVIEADVHVENLIAAGKAAGFTYAEMAIYSSRAVKSDVEGFNKFLARPYLSKIGMTLARHIASEQINRRTFFLGKGDPIAHLDSRSTHGLRAAIDLHAEPSPDGTAFTGRIVNTGSTTWLPSFDGLGSVNIGVHLHDREGRLVNADYFRGRVSDEPVAAATRVPVHFEIPNPDGMDQFELVIDLVSEGIIWFEVCGSPVLRFAISTGPDASAGALP